jgi:cytochrome o ubiquinol oxidase subunit 2
VARNNIPSALALLFAASLAGCEGVLTPSGPIGAAEKIILIDSVAIMLAIVVPVIIATLGFAWWFRASNPRAFYLPEWAFSGQLELIVWAIPLLVITFLGGIAWFGSYALDPFAPLPGRGKPVEIEVVSLDWKWLFIYPDDGIATVNQLVIPAGSPVHFRLTSTGVMNSFFVPRLGSQIYTMAGMTTQLSLQADESGEFRGLSAQFSGDGFSDMNFMVRAVAPEDFTKWLADSKASGAGLDAAGYAELAKPSERVKPTTYGSVPAGLFQTIIDETVTGAPPPGKGA